MPSRLAVDKRALRAASAVTMGRYVSALPRPAERLVLYASLQGHFSTYRLFRRRTFKMLSRSGGDIAA